MMGEAGSRLRTLWQAMAANGDTPAALLLDGVSHPKAHQHYPAGDIYDFASHAQFYYHIHREGEFGHIHLFQRAKGMPDGLAPLLPATEDNAACHVVAVGLGASGNAVELFTTNRWVTGECWYQAEAVKAMLGRMRISARGRAAPVAAWLEALLAFYAPVIADLIDRRDAAVAEWARAHPVADSLNDGRLEITSRLAIDPARDVS